VSFTPLLSLIAAELSLDMRADWTAVELGNQRFRVTDQTIDRIAAMLAGRGHADRADAVRALAIEAGPARDEQVNAYFRALGASRYVAIDVNEKFGSITMDLNRSVRRDYGYAEHYDLVIDNGTGEHIFDQRAVFENMHDLCRSGGVMVNVLPFGSFLNHGFFNFHPTLFLDLAAANDYRILGLGIGNRWGAIGFMSGPASRGLIEGEQIPLETMKKPIEGRDVWGRPPMKWVRRALAGRGYYKAPKIRLDLAVERVMADSSRRERNRFGNVFVIAILQKQEDATFRIPFQGRFVPNVEDGAIAAGYAQTAPTANKAAS
jgi:SAM-dependent methyltransferase